MPQGQNPVGALRIAVLTELYPPSLGGQELFFEGLSRTLVRRGHVVDVFCIAHKSQLPPTETRDGVTVHRFPVAPDYLNPVRPWMKREWGPILRYAFHTRRAAREGRYDFYILNQWPLLHLPTLTRAARRRSLFHWCETREGRFYTTLQAWLPRLAAFNAAISDAVGEGIHRASGRPVLTLPSGLDLDRYATRPRAERSGILALGRVAEHKNLPMLIEAFALLKRDGYEGRLIIVGDGPAMGEVRAALARSPAMTEIDLTGVVDDDRKAALLASSEILAMPSRREGFPRAVAEAMASGLPVVTSAFPDNGTRDVVAATGCGVVAGTTAETIAAGIAGALAGWQGYSDAGLAAARDLDWNRIVDRLETEVMERLNLRQTS